MSIKPSGEQLEQLTQALLSAFKYDELEIFTLHKLDKVLEQITTVNATHTTITSELVKYFASQPAGLRQLLDAAVQERPQNNQLTQVANDWSEYSFDPIELSLQHPSITNQTNTEGGASFQNDVAVGGDLTGRDKNVGGDEVGGDKIVNIYNITPSDDSSPEEPSDAINSQPIWLAHGRALSITFAIIASIAVIFLALNYQKITQMLRPSVAPIAPSITLPTKTIDSPNDASENQTSSTLETEESIPKGDLELIYHDVSPIVNPYHRKEVGSRSPAASLVLEPLANINPNGELVPKLALKIPSLENGGISEDLRTVIWNLREDALWADGAPFTVDDVLFTYEYCVNLGETCKSYSNFEGIEEIKAVDQYTVEIIYTEPTGFPFKAFVKTISPILQRKQFQNCIEETTEECQKANETPIGTGPYQRMEVPSDNGLWFEYNPHYRHLSELGFARVHLREEKVESKIAARSVMAEGTADYAWTIKPTSEYEGNVKGDFIYTYGLYVQYLAINHTNASASLGNDKRSVWEKNGKNAHPIFTDKKVVEAMSRAIGRSNFEPIYDGLSRPTCAIIPSPVAYSSITNPDCLRQNLQYARQILQAAGWIDTDEDGIREKDGVELHIIVQAPHYQDYHESYTLIRRQWESIGISSKLILHDKDLFVKQGYNGPESQRLFYADVQLSLLSSNDLSFQNSLSNFICAEIPTPNNGWQGKNIARWCNPEYDARIKDLNQTADSEERYQIVKELNDMLVHEHRVLIPLINRGFVSAKNRNLAGVQMNYWDSDQWNIHQWRRLD